MTDGLRAVLFDLDDTLFDQSTWLSGAWDSVARAAIPYGVEPRALVRALHRVYALGSDRGDVIDRALALVGRSDVAVAPLLSAFRAHAPTALAPYAGVTDALDALRGRVAIALVSDGDPTVQRAKVRALGLEPRFDVIVFGDELGREHRKPSPVGLLTALVALGVDPTSAVVIGDRPRADIAAAHAAGIRAVRVRTGEFAGEPDVPRPWATAPDVAQAVDGLLELALVDAR
jgi:putative hydrolase of the HAD superfamily